MTHTPLYLDWSFWTALVALLALVLSQLPPLYALLKPARLEVEAYARMHVTHDLGSPIAQLHIVVTNMGGQVAKIKSVSLNFNRRDGGTFELAGFGYYQNPTDNMVVLMTPFRLRSKDDWGHIIHFFNPLPREEQREVAKIKSALRNNISSRKLVHEDQNTPIEAPPELVTPATDFFQRMFKWRPDDYDVMLNIQTEPAKHSVTRQYRMTIFESDTKQLEDRTQRYKYGAGVYFPDSEAQMEPVFIPLVPA